MHISYMFWKVAVCAQSTLCYFFLVALKWRHNGHNGASNHQPYDCLLNRKLRHRSKKTSKLRVAGDRWIPAQMASNAENVSIWWRHHVSLTFHCILEIIYIPWVWSKLVQNLIRIPWALQLNELCLCHIFLLEHICIAYNGRCSLEYHKSKMWLTGPGGDLLWQSTSPWSRDQYWLLLLHK